ncbi:glycosyltransferase [Roseomonas xinghualingensis]|uniref:glycosyltransferase n=1 Tax=Roseomonas xinghualingensis TaxID=2986475 RepID=UPI0021F24A72|nr:glycosyltransferase [Roseomonas sp. SXEYE001]MCV4208854.1 glycosyltransferase [Roseomonas sp. SXEYE001]
MGGRPDVATLETADALCAAHLQAGTASVGLQAMLDLVRRHPGCERLQVLAARLLDRASGRDRAIPAWIALSARFPACQEAFLLTLRWIFRMEGGTAARKAIAARFPMQPGTVEDLLLRARARDELGAIEEAAADFVAAFQLDPSHEMAPLLHARMLERRGDRQGAREVLAMALRQAGPAPRLSTELDRMDADLRRIESLPPLSPGAPSNASTRVLAHLLQEAIRRRGTPAPRRGALGPVMLVNGCLGAGGAERQLVNTAVGLQRAHEAGIALAGHRIDGPIEVVCRSLDDRPGADFFLPALRDHGVPVSRYDRFPVFGGDPARSIVAEWRDLLHFLPPRVLEGTTRLADAFHARAPSVVHLWQDGTILAGALAALLAGVPRIVLSVRGAPPPDRPERDRPEYAVLYPLLMQAPGVIMMANSRFAAGRYAEWIALPKERVAVAPNGLSMPAAEALGTSQALMDAFTARTGPGFTVGGVMRLVENKRPLPWIDCAARVLALRPDARFIIVGDGELRDAAEARAESLGIADRILFAGRRPDVGFWMHQFDAFLLLSRTEGLPNVLIEAQAAGVPVVTTPAGGAAETLLQGETGWVLGSASVPDLNEAAARLVALAGSYSLERSERARRFVKDRFSLARMIEQTMEAYVA